MPLVQAGELLRDLEDAFLSYLRLSMCGVWRKSSLVQTAMLGHSSEGSPCCWRDGGRAEDPENAPCQGKGLMAAHVEVRLNTRHV